MERGLQPGICLSFEARGGSRAEVDFTPTHDLPLPPSPHTPAPSSSFGDLGPNPKPSLCKAPPQDICAADSSSQLVTKLKTFNSSVIIFSGSFYFILLHIMNYVQYFWYSRKTLYQICTKENL